MDEQRINNLANKWLKGTINEQETQELESWYNTDYDNLEQEIKSDLNQDALGARIFNQISRRAENLKTPYEHHRVLWRKISAAAAILIIFGAGLYFYTIKNEITSGTIIAQTNEIHPGGNKAYLTLSNGHKIDLTDVKTGNVSTLNGVTVSKNKDGQLIYTVSNDNKQIAGNNMNTLSTPAGGQYQVTLPDGTHIWMNSSSSLTYPEHFSDKERRVTLRGEAYFEVAHESSRPFRILTGNQEVEVLGTHFNINGYEDERVVKTTLLEGSVKIAPLGYINGHENQTIESLAVTLKPGEQGLNNGGRLKVTSVDANYAVSWKDGYFRFDGEKIQFVMRELARWYDIDVKYEGKIAEVGYYIKMSRSRNISEVLKVLERTNSVYFKIDGRRVTVLSKK